jgi:accessory gene regulator protein AgrB
MKPILMVVHGFINVYLLGEGDLCMSVIVLSIISFLEVLDVVWFTINLHPLFPLWFHYSIFHQENVFDTWISTHEHQFFLKILKKKKRKEKCVCVCVCVIIMSFTIGLLASFNNVFLVVFRILVGTKSPQIYDVPMCIHLE